jgi:hypothetical protein
MIRKILSMILVLCMVLTMMPVPTMAVEDINYNIWVGGIRVTSENKVGITGAGITGTVSYDPITSTLTLKNANISSAYNTTGYNDTVCIYSEANIPLILNLIGENIITGVNAAQSSYGIRCNGKLTIKGEGSLSVTSGKGSSWGNNDSSAILTQGGLIINDTTLHVRGEKYGLFGYINSNITINGSTVTAYGSNYAIRGDLYTSGQKVSVMVGDKEPGEEWDGSKSLTGNYKYVNIELDPYFITDIAMTNATSVNENMDLILEGTVSSNTNINNTIIWNVEDANGTGATINDGIFRATSEGTVKVKASVKNGLTASDNFTKIFDITVMKAPVVITHTITATVTTGGSISPSGSVTVNNGENQTFTITPNSNYSISDVTVDGISIGTISTYTFSNVSEDHTISVTFIVNAAPVVTHVITATAIKGGSISPSGSVIVNNGESKTFTITPNRNYSIDDVKVDGNSQGPISTYTFSSVTEDHTISATFKYNGSDKKTPSKSNSTTDDVVYNEEAPAFTDIANHWAKEDIEFVVSRGLFGGTSDTTFSPDAAMTRGMFVTVLGRLANAEVDSYNESSFNDVKSDAYYMGYIEWASKNNIVKGIGNGNFAPDQAITREQMAVIMSNYANAMDIMLTQTHGENTFADMAKISDYANDAVQQMQMEGILRGKNGNLFDPQGTATRAEVSAVLHRFVELSQISE